MPEGDKTFEDFMRELQELGGGVRRLTPIQLGKEKALEKKLGITAPPGYATAGQYHRELDVKGAPLPFGYQNWEEYYKTTVQFQRHRKGKQEAEQRFGIAWAARDRSTMRQAGQWNMVSPEERKLDRQTSRIQRERAERIQNMAAVWRRQFAPIQRAGQLASLAGQTGDFRSFFEQGLLGRSTFEPTRRGLPAGARSQLRGEEQQVRQNLEDRLEAAGSYIGLWMARNPSPMRIGGFQPSRQALAAAPKGVPTPEFLSQLTGVPTGQPIGEARARTPSQAQFAEFTPQQRTVLGELEAFQGRDPAEFFAQMRAKWLKPIARPTAFAPARQR